MFIFDSFIAACKTLEWNLSFSIGDVVTLIVAIATILIGVLTWRIQREQKKIIERQVRIDELKFKRDNHIYKKFLINAISLIAQVFIDGGDPDRNVLNWLKQNSDFIEETFDKDVSSFVHLLLFYDEYEKEWMASIKGRKTRNEFYVKIKDGYDVIIENLLVHSCY